MCASACIYDETLAWIYECEPAYVLKATHVYVCTRCLLCYDWPMERNIYKSYMIVKYNVRDPFWKWTLKRADLNIFSSLVIYERKSLVGLDANSTFCLTPHVLVCYRIVLTAIVIVWINRLFVSEINQHVHFCQSKNKNIICKESFPHSTWNFSKECSKISTNEYSSLSFIFIKAIRRIFYNCTFFFYSQATQL